MTAMELSTRERIKKTAKFMFYHESQIERALKEYRMDTGRGHTGGGNAHALVSDPTAIQGIKNATEIRSVVLDDGTTVKLPERWMSVIKATYGNTTGIEHAVLVKRYRERKTIDEISADIGLSPSRVYEIHDDCLRSYVLAACVQAGILKVY